MQIILTTDYLPPILSADLPPRIMRIIPIITAKSDAARIIFAVPAEVNAPVKNETANTITAIKIRIIPPYNFKVLILYYVFNLRFLYVL